MQPNDTKTMSSLSNQRYSRDVAEQVYKRLDDRNPIRVYRQFVQRYENDPSQNARVLESILGQARILKKSNSTRRAIAMYKEVLNEFGNRGLEAGSAEAKYPAEAAFELVDYEFRDYQRLEISGSLARQGKIIQDYESVDRTQRESTETFRSSTLIG